MKKIILLFLFIQCVMEARTQTIITDIDDSAQGSGNNQFNYVGSWAHATATSDPYMNQTVSYSNMTGNYVTLNFTGNKIDFYTAKASNHGISAISIDNGAESNVDLYSATRQNFVMAYTSGPLSQGNHTIKIRVTGTKNVAASNSYVIIDYVKAYSASTTNTATGYQAFSFNTTGDHNTAHGAYALYTNTVGNGNSAFGADALRSNVNGSNNTANGVGTLVGNTSGNYNTATGAAALSANTQGSLNAAYGWFALVSNTTGNNNVATGSNSLANNTEGYANTATGTEALYLNTTGERNSAYGARALFGNNTGSYNDAIGYESLFTNTQGSWNIAHGIETLYNNTIGNGNTAIGPGALVYNITGNYNTALGFGAGCNVGQSNLENSTALGYSATTTASNQIRIGNSSVTSIGGQVSWSTLSDGRFKKDIKEDVSGLEFIDQLRPVSYSVDKDAVDKFLGIPDSVRQQSAEARKKPVRQTGFVAQEVDAVIKKTGYVFHGVEAPQNEKDHYSIRYAEFVVPLVKAVQELNANDKEQQALIDEQKKTIDELKQQLGVYTGLPSDNIISETKTVLYQNNPNPFSQDTEIKMSLSENSVNAVVIVYNLEGKQLKDIRVRGRGNTSVKIAGSEFNAGMYLYALIVDGKVVDTKRMILTK